MYPPSTSERSETKFQAQVISPLWLSPYHAKYPYPLLLFDLQSSIMYVSLLLFFIFLPLSNNRMSLTWLLNFQGKRAERLAALSHFCCRFFFRLSSVLIVGEPTGRAIIPKWILSGTRAAAFRSRFLADGSRRRRSDHYDGLSQPRKLKLEFNSRTLRIRAHKVIAQSIYLSFREAVWNKCKHRPASQAASVLTVLLFQRKIRRCDSGMYGCVWQIQHREWKTDVKGLDVRWSSVCVWVCVQKKKKQRKSWRNVLAAGKDIE